ncbi:enoyl-CoA hydratase/isomerase family protein [Aquimarina sp. W85]|uniref:enoyl-CoA hydratase/isomerase family protein n=1 Tax=Aquimarina rhodophyticola TaxID=3342246 RepID=UPI00366DF293
MDRSKESLYIRFDNGVGTIEIGHQNDNQLDTVLLKRLEKSINEIEADNTISILVLSSQSNEFFCSGLLPELLSHTTVSETEESLLALARVLIALQNCSKLLIANVKGKLVDAGIGLIGCCDYVFATEAASLQVNQVKYNLAPLIIQLPLLYRIGSSSFDSLIWTPNLWKNAYWSLKKGLYHRVFEKSFELDQTVEFFIQGLDQTTLSTIATTKLLKRKEGENWSTQFAERALHMATNFHKSKNF